MGFAPPGPPSAAYVAGPGPIKHPAPGACPRPQPGCGPSSRGAGARSGACSAGEKQGLQHGRWATRGVSSAVRSARSAVGPAAAGIPAGARLRMVAASNRAAGGVGHSDGRANQNTGASRCERIHSLDPSAMLLDLRGKKPSSPASPTTRFDRLGIAHADGGGKSCELAVT